MNVEDGSSNSPSDFLRNYEQDDPMECQSQPHNQNKPRPRPLILQLRLIPEWLPSNTHLESLSSSLLELLSLRATGASSCLSRPPQPRRAKRTAAGTRTATFDA